MGLLSRCLTALVLLTACSPGTEGPEYVPADHLAWDAAGPDGSDETPDCDDAGNPGQEEIWQGLLDLGSDDFLAELPSPADIVEEETGTNPLCQGNGDGELTADELPVSASMGLVSTFTVLGTGPVTLPGTGITGTYDADAGGTQWDFSGPLAGDQLHYESILPLTGYWFADRFDQGDFVQPFSKDSFGIYSKSDQALFLHGLASVDGGPEAVVLVYDPPVPLLAFPVAKGKSWNADEVDAAGRFEGEEYPADYGLAGQLSIRHSYHFTVDKAGTLHVPMGAFDVLRVYADVDMEVWNSNMVVPVASQRVKLVYFVAECAGTVALVRSVEGETNKEFTKAAEYKRLGANP